MTTKKPGKYLKLHETTVCRYAAQGEIPGVRFQRAWGFDKNPIEEWMISGGPGLTSGNSFLDAENYPYEPTLRSQWP